MHDARRGTVVDAPGRAPPAVREVASGRRPLHDHAADPPERPALTAFLVRRVMQAVVVLLLVTMLTFALLRMIPGNVAVAVMGPTAYRNAAAIKVFNADYGFNLPWYRQYFLWLGNLLRGNLGYSWTLNQSVASLLKNALPKTIILVGTSTLLALIVAIPVGVVQAVRRNKLIEHVFNGSSTIFDAMPDFLIGILLILVFAI